MNALQRLASAERLRNSTELRAGVLLIVVVGMLALWQQGAVTNYGLTLERVAAVGIIALGLTLVLILGEIDLSVAATATFSGVVAAKLGPSIGVGVACGLAVALLIGCINAFLVTVVKVTSFIATLGTMIALQGLALAVSDGAPVPIADPELVLHANSLVIGQLTPIVLVFAGCACLLHVGLSRAQIGRDLYVVGGNLPAATAASIPVRRRTWMAFIACALFAGVAGVVSTATEGAADPNTQASVLLTALAAAVIGGAHLEGGRGTAIGTTMALLAIGAVSVGLDLSGAGASIQEVVVGAILVAAVITSPASVRRIRNTLTLVPRPGGGRRQRPADEQVSH